MLKYFRLASLYRIYLVLGSSCTLIELTFALTCTTSTPFIYKEDLGGLGGGEEEEEGKD